MKFQRLRGVAEDEDDVEPQDVEILANNSQIILQRSKCKGCITIILHYLYSYLQIKTKTVTLNHIERIIRESKIES